MEVCSGVLVVLASDDFRLHYIDETQDNVLWLENMERNDHQLQKLPDWYASGKERISIAEKTKYSLAIPLCVTGEDMNLFIYTVMESEKSPKSVINGQLMRAKREKSDTNEKLKLTYKERVER